MDFKFDNTLMSLQNQSPNGDIEIEADQYLIRPSNRSISVLQHLRNTTKCGEVLVGAIFPSIERSNMSEDKIIIDGETQVNYLSIGKVPPSLPKSFIDILIRHKLYNSFCQFLIEVGYKSLSEGETESVINDPEFNKDFWTIFEEATLSMKIAKYLLPIRKLKDSSTGVSVSGPTGEEGYPSKGNKKRGRPKKVKEDTVDTNGQDGDSFTVHDGLESRSVSAAKQGQSQSLTVHHQGGGYGNYVIPVESFERPIPKEIFSKILEYYRKQYLSCSKGVRIELLEYSKLRGFIISPLFLPKGAVIEDGFLYYNGVQYDCDELGEMLTEKLKVYLAPRES